MSPKPLSQWIIRTTSILLGAALFCPPTRAQQPKVLAPHRPLGQRLEKRLPVSKPMARQSATGGLWMTDANWEAALHLRNRLKTDPITVTPVLYLSNGQRYPLSSVTLEPSGTAIVDIGKGLESIGIAPYATLCGYAEIEYQWAWAAVTATVKNVDVVNSLIFIFGLQPSPDWHPEHMASMPARLPTSFEALWWKHEKDVSGFVALSNVTGQPIHATVRLTDNSDGQLASYQVTISPHGTKMLTLDQLKTTASDLGGVYLTHDGPERGLDINGGLQDPGVGYSAHLRIWPQPQPPNASQPQPTKTMSFSELSLMTGAADPMMNLPSGTVFTPYSLVRNISDQPAQVTPELWWMADGSPHSAKLPQMTVGSHQTADLNVPALLTSAGLKNFNGSVNLILDTKAQPAGLLMSSGSVDQKNTYVFEVIPHAVEEGSAKELCYWSTGNGDDTMVTLWNPADEPQDLALTLFYTGGQYVYPIQIGPRETRSLNVSEILHTSIPDAEGNVIPAGITEGSAEIAGSLGEHQHILISLDTAVYNVRKATCGNYCWYCSGVVDAFIQLSPFAVAVGGTTAQTFYETHDSGYQYSESASWSSSSKSVATVNSGGVVTGVAVGSISLGALDLYDETVAGEACSDQESSCPTEYFSASTPGNSVAIPVNFRQASVTQQANGVLQFIYYWDSSSGNTNDIANCQVGEIVYYPGTASPYKWTQPPYTQPTNPVTINPFTANVAGSNWLPAPDSHVGAVDTNTHPSFVKPYTSDNFTASQNFRFQCSNYNNGNWNNFTQVGIPITRNVTVNTSGSWKYSITKSGASNTVNPMP